MSVCSALRQVDSGFFCEGYSSDEDVLIKEEFRGNVMKQGCLLKQVGKMFLSQKKKNKKNLKFECGGELGVFHISIICQ